MGFCGQSIGHWGHALEEDRGTWASSSLFGFLATKRTLRPIDLGQEPLKLWTNVFFFMFIFSSAALW